MIEHAEQPTNVSDVRKLVEQLSESPEDDRVAQVLADWLESVGIAEGSRVLRTGRDDGPKYLPVLASLRTMFGIPNESGGETGRYTAVIGFPLITLIPGQVVVLEAQAHVICRIRRLIIPNNINQQLLVHDLRAGKWSCTVNSCPLPGELFGEKMPDLFCTPYLNITQRISLTIENNGVADVELRASVLGDSPEMDAAHQGKEDERQRLSDMDERIGNLITEMASLTETIGLLRMLSSSQGEQLAMLRKRLDG